MKKVITVRIDITACNLNISCPKNTINNEFGKNNERISVINIDLTSTSLLDNKFINKTSKKERESFEIKPKIMNKRMTLPIYNNIYELEKDINEQYIKDDKEKEKQNDDNNPLKGILKKNTNNKKEDNNIEKKEEDINAEKKEENKEKNDEKNNIKIIIKIKKMNGKI